jgi:hypothetical protein
LTGLLAAKDPTFDDFGQRIPHTGIKPKRFVAPPSSDLARDLARGRHDIVFYARRFLGIDLHPGQVRFAVAAAMRGPDGYSPAFLDLALASGNRAGKTLVLAVVVFHSTFYKLGIPINDEWSRRPYAWYHLGSEGKMAWLVHSDLQKLFTGSHAAQMGRGCPLIDELGPIVQWDKKWQGEYPWVKVRAEFGGGELHFRHTNEKAKALLGLDMNGISFDEAAFELYLTEIRSEVLHLRRLATGGPIYWVSTGTEGYNAFADLWLEGDPENPRRHPRSLSLRMSTRDNIGFGITKSAFDALVATYDSRMIPQNIDGYFIESLEAYFNAESVNAIFDAELKVEEPPQRGHRYENGVDPGISADATWSIVVDYTNRAKMRGVRAVKRAGKQQLPAVVNMVREGHLLYSQDGAFCETVVDSTGMGGKMYRQEFSIIRPLREFDFAGTKAKKLELLADLRTVIDRREIELPSDGNWRDVRRQLLGYKLDDKKIEQDAVMTLAMAVRRAIRNPLNPVSNPSLSYFGA